MPLERDLIIKSLCAKGFELDNSGDHIRLHFVYKGKKYPIGTKISHGSKYRQIGDDNLIGQMARQVKLTKSLFENLVECNLSFEGYVENLKSQGFNL